MSTYPVEESAGFSKHPAPFGQLDLALFQCLVAVIQRNDALLKALAAIGQLVDLGRQRGGKGIGKVLR